MHIVSYATRDNVRTYYIVGFAYVITKGLIMYCEEDASMGTDIL